MKKVIPKTEAQLKDIEKAISRCFLFSSLDEDQRKEVSYPLPCTLLGALGLSLDTKFMANYAHRVLGSLFHVPACLPHVRPVSTACPSKTLAALGR